MTTCIYNPNPPRVWSRVQNQCTYVVPDSTYEEAYIPLTGQIVSQAQADYETKLIYKGNILQYKGNSARLTKSQKYSQLARMAGPNRTKVFATQSETYTNPNTTGLLRSGYTSYTFPNEIVGAPNNISGPFEYNIQNPNDCSGNSIQVGGILVCGTYANPCSGEIYKQNITSATICNPASASNVPGPGFLCWNNNVQTWFPRQKYTMNNSTDKWPVNYKWPNNINTNNVDDTLLTNSLNNNIHPPPILYLDFYIVNDNTKKINTSNFNINNNNMVNKYIVNKDENIIDENIIDKTHNIAISWRSTHIFPIDSFNIYINGKFYKNVINNDEFNHVLTDIETECIINITSIIGGVESAFSNPVLFKPKPQTSTPPPPPPPPPPTDSSCCDLTNVNNLLTIIDEKINIGINKIDNLNSNLYTQFTNLDVSLNLYNNILNTNINNKFSNLDASLNLYKTDIITSISDKLDEQYNNLCSELDIKLEPIIDGVNTLSGSILNLISTANNIFDKVSLLRNCDCSGCCCGCSDSSCNCDVYNTLFSSNVITQINEYVLGYVSTIYEDTDTYIPIDVFDTLNAELVALEDLFVSDPSCCFINVIDIYRNMLKIVKSGYDNKNLAKTTLINAEAWKQDSITLRDPDKLKEYLELLNKSFSVLDFSITATKAILKPQYTIYHSLYGIPNNLEYDPFLMKSILDELSGDY